MIDIVAIQETHRMIKGIEKKQRFISNLTHGSGIGEFECPKPRGRAANLIEKLSSVDEKHDFVERSTFIIQDAFADKATESMIIHCLSKFIFKQINFNFPMSKTNYARMLIDIIREDELPALIAVYRAMLNISQSESFVPPPERMVHEIHTQESQLQFLLDQIMLQEPILNSVHEFRK